MIQVPQSEPKEDFGDGGQVNYAIHVLSCPGLERIHGLAFALRDSNERIIAHFVESLVVTDFIAFAIAIRVRVKRTNSARMIPRRQVSPRQEDDRGQVSVGA